MSVFLLLRFTELPSRENSHFGNATVVYFTVVAVAFLFFFAQQWDSVSVGAGLVRDGRQEKPLATDAEDFGVYQKTPAKIE